MFPRDLYAFSVDFTGFMAASALTAKCLLASVSCTHARYLYEGLCPSLAGSSTA